jgi:ribosomal protein S18 acetylase RimI-like enzyme
LKTRREAKHKRKQEKQYNRKREENHHSNNDGEDVQLVEFDHHFLVNNPAKLEELARVYCSIWERDENFKEYRICHYCNKYFSWEQVEIEGIKTCVKCGRPLELAWNPEEVKKEILEQSKSKIFSGILVIDKNGHIQGFAWATSISFEDVQSKWGPSICTQIKEKNHETPLLIYFDEFAVTKEYRGKGIGTALAKKVLKKILNVPQHQQYLSFLRTHKNSPAVRIYQKLGYKILCEDTQYGGGRILMYIPKIGQLNLESDCVHN